MKKTKFLMLAFAALTFTLMGCSLLGGGVEEKNEEEKGIEVKYETFEGTPFRKVDTYKFPYATNTLDIVEFGDWPQTIKANDVKIDESTAAEVGAFTYFKGSDDAWYCKAKEITPRYAVDTYYYSDGSEVGKGGETFRWFKVEPIRWFVWKTENNKSFITPQRVLVADMFYDYTEKRNIGGIEVVPSNYDHSRVRAYLNGYDYQKQGPDDTELITDSSFKDKGFLQTAFADNISSAIAVTEVKNDQASAKNHQDTDRNNPYVTGTTLSDKVFLVSVSDVTTDELDLIYAEPKPVDFVFANFIRLDNANKGLIDYFLRTPCFFDGENVETRSYFMNIILQTEVYSKKGIIPGIWIQK